MREIFFQPITTFLVLKPATRKALGRLGINTVRDLVFYKPYSYKILHLDPDLTKMKGFEEVIITVKVEEVEFPRTKRGPVKIYVSTDAAGKFFGFRRRNIHNKNIDASGIVLVFFSKIPAFIMSKLQPGHEITISGKLQVNDNNFQITHPEFMLKPEMISEVEPVYHLTYGLMNKQLAGYIRQVIAGVRSAILRNMKPSSDNDDDPGSNQLENLISNEQKYLLYVNQLISELHLQRQIPDPVEITKRMEQVREKLAELELFSNQALLHKIKKQNKQNKGHSFNIFPEYKDNILNTLGFKLTEGQAEAIKDIEADLYSDHQMMKLLQGDVGSGKTLVALLSMINVVANGYQCSFMAPTDLLSVQHYEFIQQAVSNLSIESNDSVGSDDSQKSEVRVALLTGKTRAKEKRQIKQDLVDGKIDILIGTHALFQDDIEFKRLGFVIIDEQHRFGVEQRLELINRGEHPDVLVMTATPIPRSLTLTMFGDMSVSQITSKPKNRLPIITSAVPSKRLPEIIKALGKKMDDGEKIYWVCPLIDQSDKSLEKLDEKADLEKSEEIGSSDQRDDRPQDQSKPVYADVTSRFEMIEKLYPGAACILHGKIKAAEKDMIMQDFKDSKIKILVATTVIEVGIDVSDATLMVIENAEKFGLAQLHQLRGRVGRGDKQSHCLLIYNEKRLSKAAKGRIETMRKSSDGFYISEQDLALRGAGEMLGTKQSGEPDFLFADLSQDMQLLLKVNNLARKVVWDDFADFHVKLFSNAEADRLKSG